MDILGRIQGVPAKTKRIYVARPSFSVESLVESHWLSRLAGCPALLLIFGSNHPRSRLLGDVLGPDSSLYHHFAVHSHHQNMEEISGGPEQGWVTVAQATAGLLVHRAQFESPNHPREQVLFPSTSWSFGIPVLSWIGWVKLLVCLSTRYQIGLQNALVSTIPLATTRRVWCGYLPTGPDGIPPIPEDRPQSCQEGALRFVPKYTP